MSGTSTLTVTASAAGNYTVTVTGTSGTITHSTTVTVTVTSGTQVAPPVFTQTNWKQRLSLSKNNFQQTFKFGIKNVDPSTTIYAQVQISAIDGSGAEPFIRESFTFQMVILWGTSPTSLTNQSTLVNGGPASGIRTSGSFTILP